MFTVNDLLVVEVSAFSDNGTHLRGEKHEGGGGFGLLVQGVDLLHRERSQKCP